MFSDSELQNFYKNYRENLSKQYELNQQLLDRQRNNAMTSIMSSANKAGMLYSNWPAITKIKYDVGTYQPTKTGLRNTYQTGLDTLRGQYIEISKLNKRHSGCDSTLKFYEIKRAPLMEGLFWSRAQFEVVCGKRRRLVVLRNQTEQQGQSIFFLSGRCC